MRPRNIASSLIAAVLLLPAGGYLAALEKPAAAAETSASGAATTADANAKQVAPTKPKRSEPVDINSAGKAELMKLPGINEDQAGKIIAGRPYLSKAELATRNIVSEAIYDKLRDRVIAKQNEATAARLEQMKRDMGKKTK